MTLRPPFCLPRHVPYAWTRPLSFQVGVICANWSLFTRTFGVSK